MKTEEVRSKTDDELRFDLANLKRELFDARIKGQLDAGSGSSHVSQLRPSIARILTILSERKLGLRGQQSR